MLIYSVEQSETVTHTHTHTYGGHTNAGSEVDTTERLALSLLCSQLIYNVLISSVQQSESVLCIYIFFFILFSILVCHRILTTTPGAIQWDVVIYQEFLFRMDL